MEERTKRIVATAVELAEEIFHMPVSLGSPKNVAGLRDIVRSPIYSTGVGLLMYGKQKEEESSDREGGGSLGLLSRLKNWIGENV